MSSRSGGGVLAGPRQRVAGLSVPLVAGAVTAALLTGCALSMTPAQPTPTIVRVPSQTRDAVATMLAATLWAGAAPTATSGTAAPAATAAATSSVALATPVLAATVADTGATEPPTATAAPQVTATAVVHVVALGETLTSIAAHYGVTVAAIAEANGIANPSLIVIGQGLTIPSPAAVPAASPAATVAAAALPVVSPTVAAMSPAPASGVIAFQVASGGDIYVVGGDGTGLHRLTTGIDPAWSPDGAMLAFARWTVPWGLYVANADGSGERMVLEMNLLRGPTWSPDGRRLAFTRQEGGTPATRLCLPGHGCFNLPAEVNSPLGLVNLDGTRREDPLADLRSLTPDWSAKGVLLYAGEHGLRQTVLSGEPRFLLEDVSAFYPRASPDGSRVALMYEQHDHWEIYVMTTDGGGLQRLTSSPYFAPRPANNVAPEWSPDGRRILFLSDRDGGWRPYVMLADGSQQQPFLPEVFDAFDIRYDYAAEHVFSWR